MESTEDFVGNAPGASRSILRSLSDYFLQRGCLSYVKTIYIGFEFEGEMVAAAYPFASSVEIALALPEDHPSPILKDATHLTWKTMPVLLMVTSDEELLTHSDLLAEAFERVTWLFGNERGAPVRPTECSRKLHAPGTALGGCSRFQRLFALLEWMRTFRASYFASLPGTSYDRP